MPANYVLLERTELNASAASVTFANIPQTGYTDLKVVTSARVDGGTAATQVSFNGGSSGTYSTRWLRGNGAAASSATETFIHAGYANYSGTTANTFANASIDIPNYTGSNAKSVSVDSVSEDNSSTAFAVLIAGLWTGTAAITSMTFTPVSGNYAANSTFSLYGLAAVGTTPVIAPKATGGNRIDYDGTYWIHTFLTNGTFTPATALTCDYLVVAGGGGAGINGGGGGAGGLRSTVTATGGGGSLESALSLSSATNYTVTVGGGGAAGNSSAKGTNGSNSIFSSITSTGGGGGGTDSAGLKDGLTGGSGGGNQWDSTAAGTAGTANQGFAGGARQASPERSGGGGGAGEAGNTDAQSDGGDGVATSISGSSVTYAGGGGGAKNETAANSVGGTGGGGNGGAAPVGTISNGTSGTTNTGGGGGAGRTTGAVVGAGGSGIVIIRYLA